MVKMQKFDEKRSSNGLQSIALSIVGSLTKLYAAMGI